jgi:hypothetical protein
VSLLERIKGMFSRAPLPEETKLLLSGVSNVEELRAGLDAIATENEVEARGIEREIEKLGRQELSHKERVMAGQLADREKMSALREIKRLRRRMDSLEKRHRIHQDNIDLHLGIFDRISEMQAMELKRVNQTQIEEIAVDYEEKLEKHRDILNAARAAQGLDSQLDDSAERKELAALERQILAEAGNGAEPVKAEPRKIARPEAPAEGRDRPVERPKVKALEVVDEELEALERELMAERAAAQADKARAEPAKAEPAKAAADGAKPSDASVARRKSIEEELAALDAEDDEAELGDEPVLED